MSSLDRESPKGLNASVLHRLPVSHPEYIYPRSRNMYQQKIEDFAPWAFADNTAEKYAGKWKSLHRDVSNNSELHVELGCNGGHILVPWASQNSNKKFIGIDWKYKQVFRAGEKAKKKNVENVSFVRAYFERLPYLFTPEEVDAFYLYFPDPWQKKSQKKNRFITPENLKMLAKLTKSGGVFHIKTDHDEYFEWMLEAISQTSEFWEPFEKTFHLHENHPNPLELNIPEVTLFEKLFIKDGIKIKSIKLRKK